MGSIQGADTSQAHLRALIDHSANLKAVFDNVYNTLKNETAAGSQDTVPVAQFYRIYESYRQLHSKLKAHAAHSRLDEVEEEGTTNIPVVGRTPILESYAATIMIKIRHQANVNRIEGTDARHLGEAISVSLEAFFSDNWFRGSVRLSSARLLDSGNVEFVAQAEHREDLERLIQSRAWHEVFERNLGPLPTETYDIRMQNMRIGCMVFTDRKEKATVIRTLADMNFPAGAGNSSVIRDISWCGEKREKPRKKKVQEQRTTALVIQFFRAEQANKALAVGLLWQGTRHACNIADKARFGLQRCLLCQKLGHLAKTCSAEPRCSRCAGPHRAEYCKSTKVKCVLCGGPHPSAGRGCMVWEQTKKTHGFPNTLWPPAVGPITEIQVAIKTEPDQPEFMLDRTQDGTQRRRTDDFRILGVARDTDLRPNATIGQKREAEDALPKAESDESTKRRKQEDLEQEIKQEDLKREDSPDREDSMPLYRQPSPYIVDRS